MAGIDYGVIVLKDGKLLPENKYLDQGMAGQFVINHLRFSRTIVTNYEWSVMSDNKPVFYLNFDDTKYYNNKYSLKWCYNNVNYHTKCVGDGIYLTTFKTNNHFYHILQGYDISLDSCYSKKSIKIIYKFLGNNKAHLKLVK